MLNNYIHRITNLLFKSQLISTKIKIKYVKNIVTGITIFISIIFSMNFKHFIQVNNISHTSTKNAYNIITSTSRRMIQNLTLRMRNYIFVNIFSN